MDADDAATAAELFSDPRWRAAARYRAGSYEDSLASLEGCDDPQCDYNRGNALARLGRFAEAIETYDRTLAADPDNEDARFNRALLEQLQQQQGQNQQQKLDQQQNEDQAQRERNSQGENEESQTGQDQSSAGDAQSGEEGELHQSAARQSDEFGDDTAEEEFEQPVSEPGNEKNAERQQGKAENGESGEREALAADDVNEDSETDRMADQWLKRIPDDPGGLLRRKFRYQSVQREHSQKDEDQAW